MRAGWLQFGRKRASATASAPDKPVTAPPAWLLGAAIVASTAALLGTSAAVPEVTYSFARTGIDGGFVELTRDQPSATFLVTLHADDLGPDGVRSTENSVATIDGIITATALDEGTTAPSVEVKLSGENQQLATSKVVSEHINEKQGFSFSGNCSDPKTSKSCTAHFTVQVSRQDQGESGGIVRFDWLFDVESRVPSFIERDRDAGPFDPPWTIEVTQQ